MPVRPLLSATRRSLLAALLAPATPRLGPAGPTTATGPVAFGLRELARAMVARGLGPATAVRTTIRPGPAESFEVTPDRVTGADERGLMYGLLAAAEQIGAGGCLRHERGAPRTKVRGIRCFRHNEALEAEWYYSREHWEGYFAFLARARFNRFNLVFGHQTPYLAPPYPFWLDLPGFPEIKVPGLSPERQRRELDMLAWIAQSAADHGIDFTLGLWEHDAPPDQRSSVVGLTPRNIGPYSYAALTAVLRRCPSIRSVQLRTNAESGIPPDRQLGFYRDYVFRAITDAGSVTLDLRGWAMRGGVLEAAIASGAPLRLSAKYWAEHLGRPYQPAETYPGYSYLDFLRKPRPYQLMWELWGLGSHRLLLWGDPDHVRRAVPTFGLGDAVGFEIDPPLAQKGFGNGPGGWSVFTEDELRRRRFWAFEWQRYWLFHLLWGRLSYDPEADPRLWEGELARRFGAAAAPEVMRAYAGASRILNEIVAVSMPDPNMYVWPEINPGGLVDAYKDNPPGDWRCVASVTEAVADRLHGRASAKQTPEVTAARLERWAEATERAVARVGPAPGNREWLSSRPDFLVLAALARYHARKQRGAAALALYDATGVPSALATARRELEAALAIWEGLARFTDGLYPDDMVYGPEDRGHWKDKLPYVRHDLSLVADREEVLRRLGPFDPGFDLGGSMPEPGPWRQYRRAPFVLRNALAPRFLPVAPNTLFDARRGYGWTEAGPRDALAIRPAPYREVRAVARDPRDLPRNALFGDAIRGLGPQAFAIRADDVPREPVLVHADGRIERRPPLTPTDGRLLVVMPDGPWALSAITLAARDPPPATPATASAPPRPLVRHVAPRTAPAWHPLVLSLTVLPPGGLVSVRLHYRPVNQLPPFKTLEAAAAGPSFTIPAGDIAADADLMYYFELLRPDGGGWLDPDPRSGTPYHVVAVEP